ncbi:putative UPF0496 protein 1 [Iris pallida]|uniref:UPF0496 protein 1 n=1 Tax=Iris pallida TaxID=29817 RepID=A0AAX6EWA8_IRIPA|nr:putative UPF0496 protein 1 [Iris pallida]KAJ6808346.1 putative UPF0496 protein 1 [Iris pallida]
MGCSFSKRPSSSADAGGGSSTSSAPTTNTDIDYTKELSSYETACRQDPEIQSFDTAIQERTSHAISTLKVGMEVHALSFETLREVTGTLLDMNQEVVRIILDCKKDIWKSPELFELVEDYFQNSLQTLDFCTVLEKCLKKVRDSQLIIHVALQRFAEEEEEESPPSGEGTGSGGSKRYERTLEELRHFKSAGDPFTEEFFKVFQSVYRQQVSMLQKLQLRKRKLDKKLKQVKSWRKLSSIIFVSAFAAVLICSVVAAAVAAPPVAAALAAAAAIPLGSTGKWIDSRWKKYSDTLKGQKEVLSTMYVGTYVAITDLDSIRLLVDRLEVQISTLVQHVDFALGDEEAVKFGIEEIKKKLEVFMKSVEDLGEQADRCSRDIGRARTVVLQRIIRYP